MAFEAITAKVRLNLFYMKLFEWALKSYVLKVFGKRAHGLVFCEKKLAQIHFVAANYPKQNDRHLFRVVSN